MVKSIAWRLWMLEGSVKVMLGLDISASLETCSRMGVET